MPGKNRSIFTIFVKRPTRAPSFAMRAARAMTTCARGGADRQVIEVIFSL